MANTHSDAEGGHGGHDHTAGANSRSLTIALALTGTFLVAELVGAWLFNSLALLSDAAHMFTDAAALAIALAAIRIGRRPPPDNKRTYGYRRFEILAAAFNALLLFAVAAEALKTEFFGRLRSVGFRGECSERRRKPHWDELTKANQAN